MNDNERNAEKLAEAVRQLKQARSVLRAFMTSAAIARHIDVAPQTLAQYCLEPGTRGFRAIPVGRLQKLRVLAGRKLLEEMGAYADVASLDGRAA